MKPNADMITKILHNFRVNGKFDQDQLIIGRGVDEQLQLMIQEGSEGVATLTFDNKTFYRRPDLDKYLVDGCTLAYGDTLTGNPTATLYRGSETWCGENWFDPEMQIGNDTPTWEATGGTADSPEGTTWGSIYDSEKTLVSTYTVTGGSDPIGIRYTPSVAGERTFTILGTTDHPVFDETVTLYPYEKPVNDFTNSWVLAEEDVIWISDKFTDPDFPDVRYIMYIGGAGGPMPNQWRVHTIGSSDTGIYGVDWNNATNTPDFLGAQENVTWSNGEASAYPTSVNDWSTSGYQGVQPASFSMTNTEGSDPKLEYTNDGTTWYPFGGSGSAGITYEPIEFTGDDLQDDGTIHIQHDFNNKNVLCLGCTPQPKEITYLDNKIVLDYSDQNSSNLVGAVWFVNSKQEMLVGLIQLEPTYTLTGAGNSDVNGDYTIITPDAYAEYLGENMVVDNVKCMYTNGPCVIYGYSISDKNTDYLAIAAKGWNLMTRPIYICSQLYGSVDYTDLTSPSVVLDTSLGAKGPPPGPTITKYEK